MVFLSQAVEERSSFARETTDSFLRHHPTSSQAFSFHREFATVDATVTAKLVVI